MEDLKKQLQQALLEIERLKQENEALRMQRTENLRTSAPAQVAEYFSFLSSEINQYSSPSQKIALFRNLFKGREEIYPIRWENKAGRTGYSPACGNEWTAVCKKPQIKCSECPHQNFLPVTDDIISNHLDARINRTIGVYPMLADETCWFLAMDFDKSDWQNDVKAVMNTCRFKGIPAALERSRSGEGAHIWIFFEEPLHASLARKLGSMILSKTMKSRYQLGIDSYDRLFPNQDTLPKGGFGSLIALPLQGQPRKQGNSVFLDENLTPYRDQWAFLSQIRKMTHEHVETLIREAEMNGEILNTAFKMELEDDSQPWDMPNNKNENLITDPLPSMVDIVLSGMVYVSKDGLPSSMINRLIGLAAFPNPDFYKTQAMRLSTFGKPRVIGCAEEYPKHIALPRGCLAQILEFFQTHDIQVQFIDERTEGSRVEVNFTGTLSMLQDTAARAVLAHEIGILSAAPAFGKTVVAAHVIAARNVSTLVLVHRRELMDQWRERLQAFLELPEGTIGYIGGGKEKRTGMIDIAVIQSLNRKGDVKEYIADYGQVIVDECHHVSAFSFEQVLKKAKAKYVVGLTATPVRQDGQQPIVLMQCGPIRLHVDAKTQTAARGLELNVIPRYTSFRLPGGSTNLSIQDVYQLLVDDEERNSIIFDDLLKCLDQGRTPIILAERTAHVEYFQKRLEHFAKNVIVLRGGMGKKQRAAIREQIANVQDHEERVFIATGKLIGEGFDDARLDTLFLVHPISWKGTLQQYAGRLHRSHANKTKVQIYDYVDVQVPVLKGMYKKRIKGYRAMGYKGFER